MKIVYAPRAGKPKLVVRMRITSRVLYTLLIRCPRELAVRKRLDRKRVHE